MEITLVGDKIKNCLTLCQRMFPVSFYISNQMYIKRTYKHTEAHSHSVIPLYPFFVSTKFSKQIYFHDFWQNCRKCIVQVLQM